jgi:hypothetical protein
VLLTNVLRIPGTPVFSYYTFSGTAPLAIPVTGTTALGSIARIQVSFRVAPSGSNPNDPHPRGSVDFQDQVFVREVDPNAATPKVQCA